MGGKRVLIIGGGFGGLAAAKTLGRAKDVKVTLLDKRNHHLFQPLLYQVSMAGLSPADIAAPIRSILSQDSNTEVILGQAEAINLAAKQVTTDFGTLTYDYLLLATGATDSYFGHENWQDLAPGLKSVEQATEIRRRVFQAFELAEREPDPEKQKRYLTFVVVGGGPTGVELAGALGEISRKTLSHDFRHIDPKRTRIMLVEGGPRILSTFHPSLSARAARDLESLGVQVWTSSIVSDITPEGVRIGDEFLRAATVLWAAGVRASPLAKSLGVPLDKQGRVIVNEDLSVPEHPEVFVIGDLSHFQPNGTQHPLPGLAPVAMQQGRTAARNILALARGKPTSTFSYVDKGAMATVGRRRAVVEFGNLRITGVVAWFIWLLVHIYYLIGFRNKVMVFLQWTWSYLTYKRGARLIVDRNWRANT